MPGDGSLVRPRANTFYIAFRILRPGFIGADNPDTDALPDLLLCQVTDFGHNLFRASFHNGQFRLRRIMLVAHSGSFWPDMGLLRQNARIHFYLAQDFFQSLLVQIAGTQDHRRFLGEIHDRGLQSDIHHSSIKNAVDPFTQILLHMSCGRRTRPSGSICTWRRDKTARRSNQRLRDLVARKAYRHSVQSAGGLIRNHFRLFQDHGQRTGPAGLRQPPGFRRDIPRNRLQVLQSRYMHDQRIVAWPALRRVNLSGSGGIQRVPSKTVHGFCRKCRQPAGFQDFSRLLYGFLIQFFFCHSGNPCLHLFLSLFLFCYYSQPLSRLYHSERKMETSFFR